MASKKPSRTVQARKKPNTGDAHTQYDERTRVALDRIASDKALLSHRHNLPAEGELHELVRELKYAAGYGTSPDNPNSMSEKDDSARRVLRLAGELIGPLVQWAIYHERGQVIAGIDASTEWNEKFRRNTRLRSQTSTRNIAANDHENERRGVRETSSSPDVE